MLARVDQGAGVARPARPGIPLVPHPRAKDRAYLACEFLKSESVCGYHCRIWIEYEEQSSSKSDV